MTPQPVIEDLLELKPSTKGYLAIDREHWMALARRCKGDLVLYAVVQLIYDDAESWTPRRPWCERSPLEFRQLTGASERKILQVLNYAEKLGWISREESDNKTRRGRYRCHPDRFPETPLPPPRPRRAKKKKKSEVKDAVMMAPRPMAALRILHTCAESDPGATAASAISSPILHNGAESDRIAISSPIMHSHAESDGSSILHSYAESVPQFAESGTVVCPIGLRCPYSVSDLQTTKQLETVETIEATTTTEAPQAAPQNVVVAVAPSLVLEELQKHGAVTPKTAVKLVSDCRKAFPGATEEEIVAVIKKIAVGFNRGTVNPIGVLLTETPGHFVGYKRPEPIAPPDPNEQTKSNINMARLIFDNRDNPKLVNENQVRWALGILGLDVAKPGGD